MPRVSIPSPSLEITDESWYTFLYTFWEYCRCNYELALGGILDNSIDVVKSSGSTATDLVNYIFEKNQLNTNNDVLSYKISGIYAANTNNKQLVLKFGSQTIFDTTAIAANGGAWIFEIEVTRTSPDTQDIFVKAFYNNLAKTAYTSGAQDLSQNIAIKLIATGVSTGDIESKGFLFNLNPIS